MNTLQSTFVDEPIAHGGLYLTPNHLGSTTTLTDASGNLAEQYFYLPFGQTWQSAGTSNPFEFTGRENDGTGFYWYRSRYYSPDLGRFLSPDLAGLPNETNEYAYGGGDPVDNDDPTGMIDIRVTIDPKTRLGTGYAYASPGDLIPPGLYPSGYYPSPTVAHGGEPLFGPFNVSNRVSNPSGNPAKANANTPSPPGTWQITGIHVPPNDPAAEAPGFIFIGRAGDTPKKLGKGMHGTGRRSSWTHFTNGCLRCENGPLSYLIFLLEVNRVPVSSRIVYSPNTGNTITVRFH